MLLIFFFELVHKISFDGGTALNAICIYDEDIGWYVIEKITTGLTNNQLEYMSLVKAARYAVKKYGIRSAFIFCGDSELIIKQMNGVYTVRKSHLRVLRGKIYEALKHVEGTINYVWVPRQHNMAGVVLEQTAILMRKRLYE